jgi:hypothetical protein
VEGGVKRGVGVEKRAWGGKQGVVRVLFEEGERDENQTREGETT